MLFSKQSKLMAKNQSNLRKQMSLKLTKKPGVSSSLLNDSMGEDDFGPRTRSGSECVDT